MSAGPLLPPGLRGRVVRRQMVVAGTRADAVSPEVPSGVAGATPGDTAVVARLTGDGTTPRGGSPTVRLAVVEIGPRDAPAWLIAHGAGSSAHVVADMFAGPVLQAGGRLVTYDLRGHGASGPARDPMDHHLDAVARDLAMVAASIDGDIEVVGGISLGGHAALRALSAGLVVDRPAAVLACLPAFAGPAEIGHGIHAAIAATVRSRGVSGLLDGARRAPDLPGWLRAAVLRDQARHDPASLAAALQALDGADAPTDVERLALGVPLGVVGWPDDPGHPLAVAARWSATAARAALVTITMGDLDDGLDQLGRAGIDAVERARAPLTRS